MYALVTDRVLEIGFSGTQNLLRNGLKARRSKLRKILKYGKNSAKKVEKSCLTYLQAITTPRMFQKPKFEFRVSESITNLFHGFFRET